MPQPYTADIDECSTDTAPLSNSNNSNSSFTQSKFDSLIGFRQWLAKDKSKHANNGFASAAAAATAATVGSGEASRKKTLAKEDVSGRRWRNEIDDEGSPQPTRKYRRGCSGGRVAGCRRRKRSSSRDEYPSPQYFEPWVWKGTTRRPYRRGQGASSQDEDDEGGSGTFVFFIIVVVIIICIVVLVKNKDKLKEMLKYGGHYFGGSDIANVKGRVVGDVKDMIDTNFDDMSWKYNDQPIQEADDDQAFENAVHNNDPSVIRHIRSFEDQLRKKPSQFFPGGGGGGGRKKYSTMWSSTKNV